jgi:hypothetical protein
MTFFCDDFQVVEDSVGQADDRSAWVAMGAGVIPPNGKKVVFPNSSLGFASKGDQIAEVDLTNIGPDSGMAGI